MKNDSILTHLQTKMTLSALWIFVLFNMLFRDMHEFARTGFLEEMLAMTSNGAEISQTLLLVAAVTLQIPIGMIVLTQVLGIRANRWANILAAAFSIVMIVSNNLAPDLDDFFFVIVECAALLFVIGYAWRWSIESDQASVPHHPADARA